MTFKFSLFLLIGLALVGCNTPQKYRKTAQQKITSSKKNSSNRVTQHYIKQYAAIAVAKMNKFGIPASITLAQGILESGSGKSMLATTGNNHFGIKCGDWKGARMYKDDDKPHECFRKYAKAEQSFHDHAIFLQRKRYANLFRLKPTDYKGWAHGLKKAGYATLPTYANRLINIIEIYNLDQYDRKNSQQTVRIAPKTRPKPTLPKILATNHIQKQDSLPLAGKTPKTFKSKTTTHQQHQVAKGETLYSIARIYRMTIQKLVEINELTSNHLSIGQMLCIKP